MPLVAAKMLHFAKDKAVKEQARGQSLLNDRPFYLQVITT